MDRAKPVVPSSKTEGSMLRVGLTGGVACGKSTVGQMLAARGAHFLQADMVAHRLYEPGEPVYQAIVERFGQAIVNDNGSINRARLANAAFPDRIGELNAIVHPAVIEAQNRWLADCAREDPHGIAVIEAALILEAGIAKHFDKLIVVTCKLEQKATRYAIRHGLTREAAAAEVTRRSAAQLSDLEKCSRADFVIDNSRSLAETEREVQNVWAQLIRYAATH